MRPYASLYMVVIRKLPQSAVPPSAQDLEARSQPRNKLWVVPDVFHACTTIGYLWSLPNSFEHQTRSQRPNCAIYYNAACQKPNPIAGTPTAMIRDFEIAVGLLQKTAWWQSITKVPMMTGQSHSVEPRTKSGLRGSSPVLAMSDKGDRGNRGSIYQVRILTFGSVEASILWEVR